MSTDSTDICGGETSDGGTCHRPAGWGTDDDDGRCSDHPKDKRGAPKGNNYALCNDGGAPKNNGNASKHNLRADRGKLYERMSEEKQVVVDKIEAALIDRYEEFHGREPDYADRRDLFELSMGPIQVMFGRDYMSDQAVESGNPLLEHVEYMSDAGPVEYDKPTQIIDMITDIKREDRLLKKHMGLFRDADMKAAEAQGDLAEAWTNALEGKDVNGEPIDGEYE